MRGSKVLGVVATAAAVALLGTTQARASSPTLTDLGSLGGPTMVPTAMNAGGAVVGYGDTGFGANHAFYWQAGALSDLGSLGGFADSSMPTGLNDAGQVCGWASAVGGDHAFRWQAGTMTDLGTLGGLSSYANGIDAAGTVVGYSTLAGDAVTHAFVWSGGVMTDLGTLGGTSSSATLITGSGDVVGYSDTVSGDIHAFVWSAGLMTDLGSLGGGLSFPTAANAAGTVVGYSMTGTGEFHPFRYAAGAMSDLGTLGGSFALATQINSAGVVIGYSYVAGDAGYHAFRVNGVTMVDLGTLGGANSIPTALNAGGDVIGQADTVGGRHAFLYSAGVMTDLGTLGGAFSDANAISVTGVVVGSANTLGDAETHAYVYEAGMMTDLGTLGGTTGSALLVNAAGAIAGYAYTASDLALHAFVVGESGTGGDTTPPTITPHANVVVEATSPSGAVVTFAAPAASDDTDPSPSVVCVPASGSTFALGTTTVDCTATDASGNFATSSFQVTVHDTTAPTLGSHANVVAEATSASGAVVAFSAPSASDAADLHPTVVCSPASGSTFAMGTTTVNCTATDASGNSSHSSFQVTVQDTTGPSVTSVTPSKTSLTPPNNKMVSITVAVTASDAVGVASKKIVSVTSNEAASKKDADFAITGDLTVDLRATRDGSGSGRVYTITVRCTDGAGNTTDKTTTVTVPK